MAKNTDEKVKIEDAIKAVGSKSLSEAGIIFLALLAMTQACKPDNSECPC